MDKEKKETKFNITKICVILQILIAIVTVVLILLAPTLGIDRSILTIIEVCAFVLIMLLNIPFIK